ncbi:polyamine ABC transporter substrate-binding protein [Halochromatium sp.]
MGPCFKYGGRWSQWVRPFSGLLLLSAWLTSAALAEDAVSAVTDSDREPVRKLRMLTWPDYIDPEVVADFEQTFAARVQFEYFDSDDARDRIVAQGDGQGFDVLVLDSSAVASYRRRGWISPIDAAKVPNLEHIDPTIDHAYPQTSGYGVPYFWGTTGIAYRADLVPEPPQRWMDLFRPEAALTGRIMMIADSYDLIGMALKALGFSMNSVDDEQLDQATALLLEQKPLLYGYGTLDLGPESLLVSGEVVAAMSYSGDAAMLMEQHDAIRYLVPEEGGPIWIDYLTIGAQGETDLAAALINFLNRPEIAAQNARYLYYATPNRAAEALLPDAFLNDPLIYPAAKTLTRCEHYKPLPPEAIRRRVQAFSTVVYGN